MREDFDEEEEKKLIIRGFRKRYENAPLLKSSRFCYDRGIELFKINTRFKKDYNEVLSTFPIFNTIREACRYIVKKETETGMQHSVWGELNEIDGKLEYSGRFISVTPKQFPVMEHSWWIIIFFSANEFLYENIDIDEVF